MSSWKKNLSQRVSKGRETQERVTLKKMFPCKKDQKSGGGALKYTGGPPERRMISHQHCDFFEKTLDTRRHRRTRSRLFSTPHLVDPKSHPKGD